MYKCRVYIMRLIIFGCLDKVRRAIKNEEDQICFYSLIYKFFFVIFGILYTQQ